MSGGSLDFTTTGVNHSTPIQELMISFMQIGSSMIFRKVMAEVDRILRPGEKMIIRDDTVTISEVGSVVKLLHWRIKFKELKYNEALLCVEKTFWRPSELETIVETIA